MNLVIIAIFIKSRNFWEFIAKFVVLASYVYHELFYFFPGFFNFIQSIVHLYPPNKLFPYIQTYQVILIAIIIQRLKTPEEFLALKAKILPRALAFCLSFLYFGLFIVAIGSLAAPQFVNNFFSIILDNLVSASSASGTFFVFLIKGNIQLFYETMNWFSVLFYGLTFIFMLLFISKSWPKFLILKEGKVFALSILIIGFLLSWTVYPLNKEPLVWDQQYKDELPLSKIFKPTDRLARVGFPPCSGQPNYKQCIQEKFFDKEFGFRRYQVGYRLMSALELTKLKSFTPKPSADFIKTFMRIEETNARGILRTLQVEPSIWDSRLYDISAVNYLLSQNKIPEAQHLELVHKNKQFYLYKNKKAWPYYYLADRIETIEAYEDLYDAEKGVAYIWKDDDKIILPYKSPEKERRLELEKFEYGDVEFRYSSDEQEFLVMADSWHPNWHAFVNDKETQIIKTNGVFKGVLLPAGEGKVHLFFDNSPYKPGIWISIIAWSLFLSAGLWCFIRLPEKW